MTITQDRDNTATPRRGDEDSACLMQVDLPLSSRGLEPHHGLLLLSIPIAEHAECFQQLLRIDMVSSKGRYGPSTRDCYDSRRICLPCLASV